MAAADSGVKAIAVLHIALAMRLMGVLRPRTVFYALLAWKPICLYLDPYAYSAAYAPASAADAICVQNGRAQWSASSMHVEMSKMLEEAESGLTVILIGMIEKL